MTKKTLTILLGSALILGAGFTAAGAEPPQSPAKNSIQERVQSRFLTGSLFIDENGDGICDFARDHDNDGIPDIQDPDWSRPQDGTGQKFQRGGKAGNAVGSRNRFRSGNSWSKQSFRQGGNRVGDGACDSTGPSRGRSRKSGRG